VIGDGDWLWGGTHGRRLDGGNDSQLGDDDAGRVEGGKDTGGVLEATGEEASKSCLIDVAIDDVDAGDGNADAIRDGDVEVPDGERFGMGDGRQRHGGERGDGEGPKARQVLHDYDPLWSANRQHHPPLPPKWR
jgi:hypothetical protein